MLNYIHTDAEQIIQELVTAYQAATGEILTSSDAEALFLNVLAYREQQLRIGINLAANQNLLAFAKAPMLDYLGQLVGVNRLPAKAAITRIQYNINPAHTGITIPAGIRIQSEDGKAIFITDEEVTVTVGNTTAVVRATASIEGSIANNYTVGKINQILDPQPYLVSATNIDVTQGGSEVESDDDLRERIRLAPNSFSTAGSASAYEYWTRTISSDIGDILIDSAQPGKVEVYFIMKDGSLPTSTLVDQVQEFLSGEKIRPLTDTVRVIAPDIVSYNIGANITKVAGYANTDVEERVEQALNKFKTDYLKIGKDIVLNQIIKTILQVEGVYDVILTNPSANVIIANNQYAVLDTITLSITGSSNE